MYLLVKAFGFTMLMFYEAELIVTDESTALAKQQKSNPSLSSNYGGETSNSTTQIWIRS